MECHEIVQQISVYNIAISLYDTVAYKETCEEFGDMVFDTSIGDLDTSGIPPPLFKLRKTLEVTTQELNLQCDILKPIKVRVTSENLGKILNVKKLLEEALMSNKNASQKEQKPIQIVRYKKINVINQMFADAKNINFTMAKAVINCITSKNCSVNMSFLYAKCKLSFHQHPERLIVDSTLNSLVINTEHSIILHPLTIDLNCVLTQEKWSHNLLTTINFKSNIINFQICPNDVQTIAKVKVDFLNCINEYSKTVHSHGNVKSTENAINCMQSNLKEQKLIPISVPVQDDILREVVAEHFQDDLRSVHEKFSKFQVFVSLQLFNKITG